MLKIIRHLLLLLIATGLFGQGVAAAVPDCGAMMEDAVMQPQAASPADDCMKVMAPADLHQSGKNQSDPGAKSCKDMSLGCLARAGCFSAFALNTVPFVAELSQSASPVAIWPYRPTLLGRKVPPDLHPPAILG